MGEHHNDIIKERDEKERQIERNNDGYRKLWNKHQSNEFTKINKYKEGYCWGCMKIDFVFATLIDVCSKCKRKKDNETKLTNLPFAPGMDGFCSICGFWEWGTGQINVRLCRSCIDRVQEKVRKYVRTGKAEGHPLFTHLRKKNGKDWKQLFELPERIRI